MPSLTGEQLLGMPLKIAVESKYREGRKKYGEDWVGEPPLTELFVEHIDSVVYLHEALKRGEVKKHDYDVIRGRLSLNISLIRSIIAGGP